jgi:hypothetical protein
MSHITPSSGGHITPERIVGPQRAGGRHWTPEDQHATFKRLHPKWESTIKRRASVIFPAYTGERVYMQPFLKVDGEILLPSRLARWTDTVAQMLYSIETTARMYLMIDQAEVKVGESHRRPGPHIDGTWSERGGGSRTPDFEAKAAFEGELVILASSVCGCVAYVGSYDPVGFKAGGDCSAMDLSGLQKVTLEAGYAYVGTAATIHESIPIHRTCNRTLVRINVPAL